MGSTLIYEIDRYHTHSDVVNSPCIQSNIGTRHRTNNQTLLYDQTHSDKKHPPLKKKMEPDDLMV